LERAFRSGELQFFSSLLPLKEPNAFRRYLAPVRRTNWVVFAKPPFAGPEKVLDYVGRYTHRVAISNNRLLNIEEGNVRFRWKDYRNGNQQKTMTLSADEFIRRFLLHVLPDGLQRIRYYGFLGNRYRKEKLARCRELLGMTKAEPPEIAEVSETIRSYQDLFEQLTGICLWECPACHQGRMVCIQVLNPAAASPQVIDTS
jgi:Putative transposase